MPLQPSKAVSTFTLNRLKSANAIKEMLRASLTPSLTLDEHKSIAFPPHSDALQLDNEFDPWLDDENTDDDLAGYVRSRCDSAASVATVRADKPGSRAAKKGGKHASTKPRTAPTKRKFKRCHAVRNMRSDGEHSTGHNDDGPYEPDGFDSISGSTTVSTRTENGVDILSWTSTSSNKSVDSDREPSDATILFREIIELIADEEEAANALNKLALAASGRLRLHERFEVSIKMKTKHITLWDMNLGHTYALEGLIYVKDAKPETVDLCPLTPIHSLTVDWRTVDSYGRTPSITDGIIYATSFRGAPSFRRADVLRSMNPENGIYTDVAWEWLPPGLPGTTLGGGWTLRFWVPVPMWILKGRDVARSLINASVVLRDDDVCVGKVYSNTVNITIEHLRRERDMSVSGRS